MAATDKLLPDIGSHERQALVRLVAEEMWRVRHNCPLNEQSEYWQSIFEKLASDAISTVEAETAKGGAN